jgi:hypothetical protein
MYVCVYGGGAGGKGVGGWYLVWAGKLMIAGRVVESKVSYSDGS